MSIFKKKKKTSITSIINSFDHCSVINSKTIMDADSNGEKSVWLNPNNQKCFNYGNFELQDFIDWSNGTGKIVKGETQDEKDKFMEYAEARKTLDSSLFIYFDYLDLIDDTKLTAPSTLNQNFDWINRDNDDMSIVKSLLSSFVPELVRELSYMKVEDVKKQHQAGFWPISKSLSLLGYTYIGASNTPTEIRNISWAWNLVFAKAYYLHLLESDVKIPDIKFVHEYK